MDTDVNPYDIKLKKVLDRFLDTNFKLKNDVYLNSLLTHIINNIETRKSNENVNIQIFPPWIDQALKHWQKMSPKLPSTPIAAFTVNLCAFLCKNEIFFLQLHNRDTLMQMISILQLKQPETVASLKLAYIKLLNSLLDHSSGVQFLISTDYYKDILNFTLTNQTIYITKEGYTFMSKFLEAVINIDQNLVENLIGVIMSPISQNAYNITEKNKENLLEISDDILYRNLSPTLILIGEILDIYIGKIQETNDFRIFWIFMKKFQLEQCLNNFLMIARGKLFLFELCKVLYVIQNLQLVSQADSQRSLSLEVARKFIRNITPILTINMEKDHVVNVLKLCNLGHMYWQNINIIIPKMKKQHTMQTQLMITQIVPLFVVDFKFNGASCTREAENDYIRGDFIDKFFQILCPDTLRMGYLWRNILINSPAHFENAALAMSYMLKSRHYLVRDTATTLFQILIYSFKDFVVFLKDNPDQLPIFRTQVNFFSLLLESTAIFIEQFDLSWRDSIETICLMNISFDFLSLPLWPSKLVVKGLKLVEISISKYMSPNLALLIDRTNDSTMGFIGPLLYAKLHDVDWEVRDSALEVLCQICHNANDKFPSFQKVISESQLSQLVFKMALNDGESFVRMTALKCIREIIIVPKFWDDALNDNIFENLKKALIQETEGIVRKEAASCITSIYNHQLLPPVLIDHIYDIMTHCVVADLHWEVKVNGLGFWETVIKMHLNNEGMIDGAFPEVIFSKDTRKIVNLNEIEIRKRLVRVLNSLSIIGCLFVLVTAIQDECDFQVSKNAIRITEPFIKLLKQYKVSPENGNMNTPPSPSHVGVDQHSKFSFKQFYFDTPSASPQSSVISSSIPNFSFNSNFSYSTNNPESNKKLKTSDDIIEEILDSRDLNLLTNVFNHTDQPVNNSIEIQGKKVLLPSEFLDFTYQDLKEMLEKRKKWLNSMDSFDSLLSDVLKEYHEDDINSMDCY